MFHEYRDVVTDLKGNSKHFKKIFDAHNKLHDKIEKVEVDGYSHINPAEIKKMKKKKLKLKDEVFAMILQKKTPDYKKT